MRVRGQSLELMRRRMVSYRESQFSRLKQYQPPAGTATMSGPAHPGASARLAASAPGTHLPEKGATADCPWIPSGSSCKEGGKGGRSGWSAGAAGPSSGEERVIPPVARRTRRPHGGASAQAPQSARGPASCGRSREVALVGREGPRGTVWSVENPHGPPRAGPAVTLAPEAGREGGAVFAGLGISWDARWCLETEKRPL